MADYTQDQTDAYTDILDAGVLATISRVSSSYDAVEGERTVTAVQTESVAVVNLPASTSLSQQFENRIIEDYKKGKIRFFYAAAKGLTIEPESGDLLVFNSKVWELAGSTGLDPDGTTPIIYIFAVRASNLSALPQGPAFPGGHLYSAVEPTGGWLRAFGPNTGTTGDMFDFLATLINDTRYGYEPYTVTPPTGGELRTFDHGAASLNDLFDVLATLGGDLPETTEAYNLTAPETEIRSFNPNTDDLGTAYNVLATLLGDLQTNGLIG